MEIKYDSTQLDTFLFAVDRRELFSVTDLLEKIHAMDHKYQRNSSGIGFEDCNGARYIHIKYNLINLRIYKNI